MIATWLKCSTWKVFVPFRGAPFGNLEGPLHPIRARQIVIIKSIYLHIVVPKSAFELRKSSASRGRKYYFRVRVNNNLKSERHGYLLHLSRWDNLVLWTCFLNLWLTVTAVQDSLINALRVQCHLSASRQFFHLEKWFSWLLAANNCNDLLINDFRSRKRHSLRSTRPKT